MAIDRDARVIRPTKGMRLRLKAMRLLSSLEPPNDPNAVWIIIHQTHDGVPLSAQTLVQMKAERGSGFKYQPMISVGIKVVQDAGIIFYQSIHTKKPWRRSGLTTNFLLRVQEQISVFGLPVMEGGFTDDGDAFATFMQHTHGWEKERLT